MPRPYTKPTTTKTHSGFRVVLYRTAGGRKRPALVTGAGTGNTLNLRVFSRGAGNKELSNVAKATARTDTNVWVDLY